MAAESASKPSFSPYRRWGIGLHVCFIIAVVLSVVVMVNYLSRDYFLRLHLSSRTLNPLSPQTVRFLETLTNRVKVTIYFDATDSKYSLVAELLKEYRLVNSKIIVQTIDYLRDAGTAVKLKEKYTFLATPRAKNFVIFDCDDRVKAVDGDALAKFAVEQVPNAEEPFRRKLTAFEGERAFTSTLLAVTRPKPLKAYFLQGDGEHAIESPDEASGYLKFAAVLRQNYIEPLNLSLLGTNSVPMDCNLLVVAGPTDRIPEIVLDKIDQYLDQGGRLLVLFNYRSLRLETGLEKILAKWGVAVGTTVVKDPDNFTQNDLSDLKVLSFSKQHPIVNSLQLSALHLILPRAISDRQSRPQTAEAPRVEKLAFSGPRSFPADNPGLRQAFPLMVAVEKGAIKGVVTERGTTRIVVIGDSFLLGNHYIDSARNRDFGGYVVNWLLEQTQLLGGLGPQPVAEYRIAMTRMQKQAAEWMLLGGMPGIALVLGCLVWLRRRR